MAGRKRKRCRPEAQANLKKIEQVHSRAKEKALRLLIRTLQTKTEEADDLVQSLKSALGIQDNGRLDEDADAEQKHEDSEDQEDRHHQQRKEEARDDDEEARSNSSDQHNEVCEVCEKGGKLLCCDTCTLVFHLGCVRPKLEKLPRGKWSCAYCLADSVAKGDKEAAKRAVAAMKALSTRHSKRNGAVQAGQDEQLQATTAGRSHAGDPSVIIVRSGRRFILKEKLATIGKYDTLEQAIMAYREHTGEIPSIGKDGEDELWCSYCLDDKNIEVCAFCGCKKCFGKHDTENLLLCDGCDSEYHIYCLDPPLPAVPGGTWYCTPCLNRQSESDSEQSMEFDRRSISQSDSGDDDARRDSLGSVACNGDDSQEQGASMNGMSNGDVQESSMSASSGRHAGGHSDSEETSSHTGGDQKRIKLPSETPTVTTTYDLAAVVQLSSHMSDRLLTEDELAQLAAVCSAAIPDHLHTLLDALHQQKHLILKKLDKEESLERKKAAGKDGAAASSGEEEEDSSGTTPSSSPSSKRDIETADVAGEIEVKTEGTGSPQASRRRHPRSSTGGRSRRPSSASSSSDKAPESGRPTKYARKSERGASRRQPNGKATPLLAAKDTRGSKAASAAASASKSNAAESRLSNGTTETAGSKAAAKNTASEKASTSGGVGKASAAAAAARSSSRGSAAASAPSKATTPATDAPALASSILRGQSLASSNGLQGIPPIPPLALSQLTSGLTTEQMLQLMGSDMLLGHHQFHGLGSLGFGNSLLDFTRHHALGTTGLSGLSGLSGLPSLPLHDFSSSVTGDGSGATLTQMLRELNQRQLAGKALRPAQDDMLVATLAAALSGNSMQHFHTPDMYSSLAQANARWLHDAQAARSNSAEASTTEAKSTDSSKLSRKYPVKQK